ncbi:MAG: DUF4340 domain-containing protein [Verrucomicrobia bacterium]|nr:DUF4340 domain-containing protein [Verrucomicrobiota bacterium]
MNPKTTRVLVVLALGLFAFIYFDERHWPEAEPLHPLAAALLPAFDPAHATSIEVDRAGEGIVRAEKLNGAWRLTVPLVYPAQATRIEALLKELGEARRRAYLSAAELLSPTNRLAEFGLNPPRARLIVQADHRSFELHVGASTLVRDQAYLQVVGTDGVSVCDAGWLAHLPRAANDWRDTALLQLRGLDYNRLNLRTGAREFQADLDPASRRWRISRPLPVRADSLVLNTLLSELQNWQVARFVSDNPGADLESFGLQPPEIQVSLGRDTNELVRIGFGKSPTDNSNQVYALLGRNTNVVLIARDPLLEVLRDPFDLLRDRHLVAVPTNAVDQFKVQADDTFVVRRLPDQAWEVIGPNPFPADAELVQEFLLRLDQLQIKEFVNDVATSFDFAHYGLNHPARVYTLLTKATNTVGSATNSILAQIEFGAEQTDRVYVRRADENAIYALARNDDLPRAAFQLRDRHLWHFTTNDVLNVTLTIRGQTRKFTRTTAQQWAATGPQANTPVPLALDETVYRFGRLWADAWVAQGADQLAHYGIVAAAHQLEFEIRDGSQTRRLTLRFGSLSPWGRPYAALTIGQQPVVFELPVAIFQPYLEVLRELNLLGPSASL